MIQWFPGHMAKAKKEMEEKLRLVDIVYELLDARIPYSSKNPLINELLKNKPRLILLTKSDMADDFYTNKWKNHFTSQGFPSLSIDSVSGLNIKKIVGVSQTILKDKFEKEKARGMKPRPIRGMIVGIPNVGKSTLINKLVNKRVANVGNKPGITKAQQWVRLNANLELLDTPGVLWPKFEDQKVGMHLAITGAIRDEILKSDELGYYLLDFMKANYEKNILERYQLSAGLSNLDILKHIASTRGISNKEDVEEKAAEVLLNDFRSLRLGRITLDIL
ncbi:MAG TPA: ribosome biogenesis GTPase YlqF [Bacilli bacterium]|mgnify:FL=1|jgi:ribosome biogenesis GTPase A|nr:ribosome biogenesis GTPase YlqF [Acholeplasmataceae bacterium]HNZ78097.1 ribosome biogenesis GTPase YlqF [Bacilli bacterium]HOD60563.1 ribosome biogenesis GTPase YlqF [Bacilli bacterium]HOH61871.1 ribosome biogenesis GTPase YlqF [Bacilli bacterium]HPM14535.1 ribosome biogenesis GTPase YlqF [Bacilli bacterium]